MYPKLRFKGFDDAWEQRKVLNEVNSIDTGKSKFEAKESGEFEILGSTGVIGYDDSYDYEGDFLLTARVGANAGTLYRHSGKVKITDNTVFLQGNHIDFIFYLLDKFDLKKMSFGSGQPLIKASEVKSLELQMPTSNEEKEKIAEYFLNLDNLITLHQRQCDALKKQKQFFLQNMFPKEGESVPRIRFNGFTEPWEQRKLGDCFSERSERSSKGELIAVTINSGVVKASSLDRHDNSSQDKSNYKVVMKNDIAYNSMRMWQGACGVSAYNGILSPAYTVVIPNTNIDSSFFAFMFKRYDVIHKFRINSQGLTSDTWNLKFPAFSKISIKVPSFNEQKKISNLFNEIEKSITLHQQQYEQLVSLKKYLLSKMFI